jgi:hypothetical protein
MLRIQSCLLGLLLGLTTSGAAFAQKGKPTPPPPPPAAPGTVFYESASTIWRIHQNGTQAVAIDAATLASLRRHNGTSSVTPVPTSQTHDGQSWWIWTAPRGDGAAYPGYPDRPVLEFHVGIPGQLAYRVSDLFASDHIYVANLERGRLCWSNDDQDTFFSFIGRDLDDPVAQFYIFQVPYALVDGVPASGPIARRIPVPDSVWHDWSPDGVTALYQQTIQNPDGTYTARLMKRTATDNANNPPLFTPATAVWTNDRSSWSDLQPRWSPDLDPIAPGYQGKIAFARFRSTIERDVFTIPSNAEGLFGLGPLTTLVLSGRSMGYSQPHWAPGDGSQLACGWLDGRKGTDVSKYPRNVIRFHLAAGSVTNLTSGLDQQAEKSIIAWRLGTPAP